MTAAVSSAIQKNPYWENSSYSSYAEWRDDKLVYVLKPQRSVSPVAGRAHDRFREFILNPNFSCVGAKAAISSNCYRFGFYPEMNTREATGGLAHDLWTYVREQKTFGTSYTTFVASFAGPAIANEQSWEKLLWAQLQSLHELDFVHHKWDSTVSSDPQDADFSFSFAETAFFVVGLHPQSSRKARRFSWATLIFNMHAQFERLREKNQYERLQQTIRARELKLQGSLNPNLSDFGERSDARQYSGRAVEENWRCPFHTRHKENKD